MFWMSQRNETIYRSHAESTFSVCGSGSEERLLHIPAGGIGVYSVKFPRPKAVPLHMRTLILSTSVLCLLGCVAVRDLAQEKSDVATIRALELKWVDAYKQRQIAAVGALLAEDYV